MNSSDWSLKSKSKYTIWLFNQFENIRWLFQHVMQLCPDMSSSHSHPQKPTKYLNLHMNISQIYTLEQQLQSTSYPHYLHPSCDVKLQSYSIFTFKKITNNFCDFLLKKKNICKRKKHQ